MKLSIVTGTRNRPKSWARFLASAKAAATVETEIVVVDASTGPQWSQSGYVTERGVPPYHFDIRLIREGETRLGPIRGYNLGYREARGEYVVWLNDDCELIPGWDATAIEFMEANPACGMGVIYFKDHFGELGAGDADGDPLAFGASYVNQVIFGIVYANFGIMRREVGESVGWHSEDIGFMYGGDTDFAFKMIMAGHQVLAIPECRVIHWRQRDDERAETIEQYGYRADRAKFDAKWVNQIGQLKAMQKPWAHLVGKRSIGEPKE